MSDGEGRMTDPAPQWSDSKVSSGRGSPCLPRAPVRYRGRGYERPRRPGMQARLSPRRPLESRVNDGGSMPFPGRRAAYGQSVNVIFYLGESGAEPDSTLQPSIADLPSSSNRRTRRLSMLSIKHRALELS